MKVGELARRTGISVRTLHFYDEIGLVRPAGRTASGHRVYGPAEVERLQKVTSLRGLGLSLDEIRAILDGGPSLLEVIDLQAARLRQQIAQARAIVERLDDIARVLRAHGRVDSDELLQVMEAIHMAEKYYSDEQLEWLRQRREEVGEERIHGVEAEWPRLMAEVRGKMEAGVDPSDPSVQALMVRWRELVAEFTGGNPGIERSLQSFYDNEDTMPTGEAIDRELFAYVGEAMQAGER